MKLEHLFEMPTSARVCVCVCVQTSREGRDGDLQTENGRVGYFWICFLFGLRNRGGLPVFVQWTGVVQSCVCVWEEAFV